MHFPKEKLYVYASTDSILWKSLIETPLFDSLKKGEFEIVPIESGELLKITSSGIIEKESFRFVESYGTNWRSYGGFTFGNSQYIENLKSVANYFGYDSRDIDEMLANGYDCEEIEELLYCGEV